MERVVHLIEDVIVPEAQHEPSVASEPEVATPVSLALLVGVRVAVDLHDEPGRETSKVRDERPDRL